MTALSVIPDATDHSGDSVESLREQLRQAEARIDEYAHAFSVIGAVCKEAAEGNLEPRVSFLGENPELVDVRQQLNHLLDLTDAFVREASASLEYASDGRFFRRFLVRGMQGSFKAGADVINTATTAMRAADERLKESTSERLRLADEFEQAVLGVAQHVASAATEMEASSRGVAMTAETTAGRAAEAGHGSADASNGVASVAAAVEELVSTVGEIQRQAEESNASGRRAADEATRALDTMHQLETAAVEIGQIVNVINMVSSQTRLLALNATIEAARAGAAGKGFAVVASEVKELAAQTGTSSERIGAQVSAIQDVVAQALAAIDAVVGTVRGMSAGSEQIAHAVAEQRLATTEMSRNTQDVAVATANVSRNLEQVTQATSDTSLAAEQMTAAATELSGMAESLRGEVLSFLAHIRAV